MISRTPLSRPVHSVFQRQCMVRPSDRRCLAAASSGSFLYETSDAAGVKIASRNLPGPVAHLAVVAKAGTRYQPLPGFSDGLEKFAFKVCLHGCQLKDICLESWLRSTSKLTDLISISLGHTKALRSSNHSGSRVARGGADSVPFERESSHWCQVSAR